MRLLVLEDDEVVARGVVRLAGVLGHRATCARNLDEAKSSFLAQPFDLVLADFGLREGESGLDFLAWVKDAAPQVIRVLTSGAQTAIDANAQTLVQRFLPKPFGRAELLLLLQSAVPVGG
jgi:DNA-binding response OmpR family regulator